MTAHTSARIAVHVHKRAMEIEMSEIKELIEGMEHGSRVTVFKTESGETFLAGDNYDVVESWAADVLEAAHVHDLTGDDIIRMCKLCVPKAV